MDDFSVGCLGTSGWLATETRESACFLVSFADSMIILDAGSGMKRLLHPPEVFRRAREVHLFLSHYHLDHTIGLTYAPAVFRGKKVTLYLPSERLSGVKPDVFLSTVFGSFLFPVRLQNLPFDWSVKEYDEGDLRLGRVGGRVWRQMHTPFSAGVVLEERIGYMTDTVYEPRLAEQVKNLPLLLVAVMFDQIGVGNPPDLSHNGHMTNEGVRAILRVARPDRAYAIHISPLYEPEERSRLVAGLRADGIPIEEAVDGQWIPTAPRS
jgi:ribonuclease BN (tRNA processing enzyme)